MFDKHNYLVFLLVLVLFCAPVVTLNAAVSTSHPIILTPQKVAPGIKVKVSLRIIFKSGTALPQRITGGVDNKVLFQRNYSKSAVPKTGLPSFFWTAQVGRHRIWFKIKRNNFTKAQDFVRNIYVTYPIKPFKIKKLRPRFRLKYKYKVQLREVARMILNKAPISRIKLKMKNIHGAAYMQYHSETEGAGHQADEEALKVLQDEIQKAIWQQEQQKDEQRMESQREHIKRMMAILREMMKIWTDSLDTTLNLNK